jgi:hypothetical protein
MIQAAIRYPLTAKARVQCQASSRGIYGRKSNAGKGLSLITSALVRYF